MRIGIDFGTSYTEAAVFDGTNVAIVRFGENAQLRTAAYFPRDIPDISDFEVTPEQERQVSSLVRDSQAVQKRQLDAYRVERHNLIKFLIGNDNRTRSEAATIADERLAKPVERTDDEIYRDAVRSVRRTWLQTQLIEEHVVPEDISGGVFGERAIERYISDARGNLIQSPKSMLGYQMSPRVENVIKQIVAHFLEFVRLTASSQFEKQITAAVIGRPVKFRSSQGDAGTTQAISIIRDAAEAAGFDDIDFLEEPAAAALDQHYALHTEIDALIIDAGGGTTDLAYARIGGENRKPIVRKTWGFPRGGFDVDRAFAIDKFLPLFGSREEIFPIHHFNDAIHVEDAPRQRRFQRYNFDRAPEIYASRLRSLQKPGGTVRLNRAIERLKIFLSERDKGTVPIGYIEKGLAVRSKRDELAVAASDYLDRLEAAIEMSVNDIGSKPPYIFVTGGMSLAPYVRERIVELFSESQISFGDASLAVVRGLARYAAGK